MAGRIAKRKEPISARQAALLAHIEELMLAMNTGAAWTVNGIPGRWSADGTRWVADDPTRCDSIILVRASHADDPLDVDSVARQAEDTSTLASRLRARVGLILVENDTSAFKRRKTLLPDGRTELRTARPHFREALQLLATTRVRYFITAHLDRTVRDPRDLEDLIDVVEASHPRISVQSVGGSLRLGNDSDIMQARMMCAAANNASRDTRRRVSRSRKQLAQMGLFSGRTPYGFHPDGTHVPHEAKVVADASKAALADVANREIARDLRKAGVLKRNGKPFLPVEVRGLLLRPVNAGLLVHRSGVPEPDDELWNELADEVEGNDEDGDDGEGAEDTRSGRARRAYTREDVVGRLPGDPIVPEDDYWTIVEKLTDPSRRTNQTGNVPVLLGTGHYKCPCGDKLRCGRKSRKPETPRNELQERVYRCYSQGKGHVSGPVAEIDALVEATLKRLILISDPADIIGKHIQDVDVPGLHAKIARYRMKLERYVRDEAEDAITHEQMLSGTKRVKELLKQARNDLAQAQAMNDPAARLVGVEDIDAAWEDLMLGEKRQIVSRLLSVTLLPVGRGRRVPMRDRLIITDNIQRKGLA